MFTSTLAEALAPDVLDRFLRYVRVDTQSRRDRTRSPSTPGQLELGRMLVDELRKAGLGDAALDENGYVTATLPATVDEAPVIGLLAHLDTSPDAPGAGVEPIVHRGYDGSPIVLPRGGTVVQPAATPGTTSSRRPATRCSAPTTRRTWPRSWPPSRTSPRTRSSRGPPCAWASRPTRRSARGRRCSTSRRSARCAPTRSTAPTPASSRTRRSRPPRRR